jgi:MFS family permease
MNDASGESPRASEVALYGSQRAAPPRNAKASIGPCRLILIVLLPFAAAYYLSYLFRTINSLISAQLTSDFGLGAGDLGLLTSVYFLSFAAAQLPLGMLLDRYGPRRVQSLLLLVAAAGAGLFGVAESLPALILGRALVGLGVAAALIGGLKAVVLWFPKERVPLANGCFIMLGTLGAVTATLPADAIIAWIGWRGMFELLAAATAACAIGIAVLAPPYPAPAGLARGLGDLKAIYSDPRFWRLAPLSTMCISTAWALQGLWVGPWLTDVENVQRADVVRHLFVMAVALSAAALLLGFGADRLRRRGIQAGTTIAVVAALFIVVELALILHMPVSSYFLWAIVASVGAISVLSFAVLADCFPKAIAGQANAALNVFHIGGAFVLQCCIGLIVDRWSSHDGHYPTIAYGVALGIVVVLQFLALVWFVRPARRDEAVLWRLNIDDRTGPTADGRWDQASGGEVWAAAQHTRSRHLLSWLRVPRRPPAARRARHFNDFASK